MYIIVVFFLLGFCLPISKIEANELKNFFKSVEEEKYEEETETKEEKGRLKDFFNGLKDKEEEKEESEEREKRYYYFYDYYPYGYDPFWYRPFWYKPYYYRGYAPVCEKRKGGAKFKKEIEISLVHQFINEDTASTKFSFYYLGEEKVALDTSYTGYSEKVNGKDKLSQLDLLIAYQFYNDQEIKILGGIGAKGYYFENESLWGIAFKIKGKVPLKERFSFLINPSLAIINKNIVTDFEVRITYALKYPFQISLGYNSLDLQSEAISLEGITLGLALIFK